MNIGAGILLFVLALLLPIPAILIRKKQKKISAVLLFVSLAVMLISGLLLGGYYDLYDHTR
jgi:hypothetical protein